jgi:hypothetical protein
MAALKLPLCVRPDNNASGAAGTHSMVAQGRHQIGKTDIGNEGKRLAPKGSSLLDVSPMNTD